jgi:potassium-transporting ATPase potassium-binding subunit
MTTNDWIQIAVYLGVLLVFVKPLGSYMANVFTGKRTLLSPVMLPLERMVYIIARIKVGKSSEEYSEMGWEKYALAVIVFNALGLLAVYSLQRFQAILPLNPSSMDAVSPDSALNTAISFATNTNWQGYSGEATMSYLTQMLGLGVQNFLSAATGIAVFSAFIRGFTRKNAETIGNFWIDMTRSTLYILLPLSFILALVLVSQGVVQTFSQYKTVPLLEATQDAEGNAVTSQTIAVGPAASQIAIKQLGTNGGGFFNVNSAHPLENPTPLTNFLEMLAILLIPAALCYTFGKIIRDTRQGWAILTAMFAIFIPLLLLCAWQEQSGTPQLTAAGADITASATQSGGNMEGKEVRFGIANSAIWATATTAASNGSVNSMHDSFTPLGGLAPMLLIQFSEVVFGGAGCGLYGMLIYAIVAVFIAGLMVGRTPEYLGKKIEAYEMKMSSLIILIPPALVLLGTALAVATVAGRAGIYNPGVHGFSEVLYAFSSAGNNNGSAFAGIGANNHFYNIALGVAMFISRYWIIIPVLAIAGALARKKTVPPGLGTLLTHTPLFITMLVGVVILVGALTFVPALALGPIAEHLQMYTSADP